MSCCCRCFKPGVLFEFAPMYEALNLAMVRKGVLPGSVDAYRIQKTDNAAAAKAARASEKAALARQLQDFFAGGAGAADGFDDAIPLIPDLPSMPAGQRRLAAEHRPLGFDAAPLPEQRWPCRRAAALPDSGPGPGLPALRAGSAPRAGRASAPPDRPARRNAEAPAAAAGVRRQRRASAGALPHNVFYLPRLKQSLPQGSLSRGDESTHRPAVAHLRDRLPRRQHPAEIRDLIQFLQMPVLKAALSDKNFFFEEAHPARRMIDLLSRMGWEQRKGADDPLFQAMRRNVDRVGRDASREQGAFAEAVADLEASIAADESGAESRYRRRRSPRALKQEKAAEATRSARKRRWRCASAATARSRSSTAFLEKKWTSVLTVAYTVEDGKPGAVANATRTMDELLWSVKPKVTHRAAQGADRQAAGPAGDAEQMARRDQVAGRRPAAVLRRAGRVPRLDRARAARPVARAPAGNRRRSGAAGRDPPHREGAGARPSWSSRPAPTTRSSPSMGSSAACGWSSSQPDASVRKVKLAWVSPLRSLFIFSTGARQEAFSLSGEALAQACRDRQRRA